jgi:hypothetical protein
VFYIIGQLVPEEDDGVGHFLPAVNVFNMGPPEDKRWCLMLTLGQNVNNCNLYQFPDHLERSVLHNRTAGSPKKTMVSVIFCQLLPFSIWNRPKIYTGA